VLLQELPLGRRPVLVALIGVDQELVGLDLLHKEWIGGELVAEGFRAAVGFLPMGLDREGLQPAVDCCL
jgi:hypothetical protein